MRRLPPGFIASAIASLSGLGLLLLLLTISDGASPHRATASSDADAPPVAIEAAFELDAPRPVVHFGLGAFQGAVVALYRGPDLAPAKPTSPWLEPRAAIAKQSADEAMVFAARVSLDDSVDAGPVEDRAVPAPARIAAPQPEITASAAVVIDEASLMVLFGKNEHERRAPASLTKVATAALAVQLGDLNAEVTSAVDARQMPGSSLMGILRGDHYTLQDLLYGLMLMSGNDAARAIAIDLAGSEDLFVHWMNVMSERLGLKDTHFIDPHGLGGRDHYSTAYDLALLSRYAMQFDDVVQVAETQDRVVSGSRTIKMHNYVNPFLKNYRGAEGLKTGFTEEAGATFIGVASRNGHRLYVVLLDSARNRFQEAADLLDWAFNSYEWPPADTGQAK